MAKFFHATEKTLVVYNQKAIIDFAFSFYTEDCVDDTDFPFTGITTAYFRAYNERLGRLIKEISLTPSGYDLIFNASVADMTFEDNGNYFYEIGYVLPGGYEVALMYGVLTVL